jgi:hypothetical protein
MVTQYIQGGEKAQAAIDKLVKKLTKATTLQVGFLEGSTEADGTSIPMIAAVQEFGSYNTKFPIPPRPYFRTMVSEKSPEWPDRLAAALKATDNDVEKALNLVGGTIVGDLRDSIANIQDPPLSEVTLMLRKMKREGGSEFEVGLRHVYEAIGRVKSGETSGLSGTAAKPLIDSGNLLNAADFLVE